MGVKIVTKWAGLILCEIKFQIWLSCKLFTLAKLWGFFWKNETRHHSCTETEACTAGRRRRKQIKYCHCAEVVIIISVCVTPWWQRSSVYDFRAWQQSELTIGVFMHASRAVKLDGNKIVFPYKIEGFCLYQIQWNPDITYPDLTFISI